VDTKLSDELLQTAVEAAGIAGRILAERSASLVPAQADLKGRNDYVTEVDRESERAIIEHVLSKHPDHTILAEESGLRQADGGVRWLIDPLDGTTNYIHSYPNYAVSIAAEYEGDIVASAVLDPTRDELFTARRGGGAELNGKPIRVTETAELAPSLILTGFPFKAAQYLEDFITVFRDLLPATSGIRRCGSAAIDLAHTACGRADGFWEFGLSPWDIAAGALLVEEAGGRITDVELGSRYIETGNVLASNGLIHAALHEIITRRFPPDHFFAKARKG
jgi:myo-inositol-1(or 4)-monophosphatase